jgi:hypothetical protein
VSMYIPPRSESFTLLESAPVSEEEFNNLRTGELGRIEGGMTIIESRPRERLVPRGVLTSAVPYHPDLDSMLKARKGFKLHPAQEAFFKAGAKK